MGQAFLDGRRLEIVRLGQEHAVTGLPADDVAGNAARGRDLRSGVRRPREKAGKDQEEPAEAPDIHASVTVGCSALSTIISCRPLDDAQP